MRYLENRWPYSETDQNLGLRGKYLVHRECFWLLSVEIQFGVIRCICDFRRSCTCCSSETANRRAKRIKIWASIDWLIDTLAAVAQTFSPVLLYNGPYRIMEKFWSPQNDHDIFRVKSIHEHSTHIHPWCPDFYLIYSTMIRFWVTGHFWDECTKWS